MELEPLREGAPTAVVSQVGANAERWEEPLRREAATMVLEPLREEALTTREFCVGANADRWEEPLRREAATMVLEPLREEALPAVLERQVSELKDELEPLWEEVTMPQRMLRDVRASSREVCFLREPD